MLDGVVVTITDIRKAGYCVAGVRRWCPQHDIVFADLIRDGIPAAEFIAKGDEHARRVVENKLKLERENG